MLVGLAIVLVCAIGLFVCARASRASSVHSHRTQGAIWLLLIFGMLLPVGLVVVGFKAARHIAQLVVENDVPRTSGRGSDRGS